MGKSTLVEQLRDQLTRRRPPTGAADCKVDVLRKGPPRLHPLDEYEVPLLTYRPLPEYHVICDRWHLGELVYPPVFGRRSALTDPGFRHIELLLASRGALVVLLDAPVERIQRCVDERGDDLVTRDQVGEIRKRFLDAAARTSLPLVHVSGDDVGTADTVREVLYEAEQLATTHAVLSEFTTYVGPRWPRRLLLGDVRLRFEPDDPRPAFMPYDATSGHYLLDALGDDARFVGLANACDVDDAEHLARVLGATSVVTLGVNAARATSSWRDGVVTARVPHPQYVRRFHHSRADDYRRAIVGESPWRP